MGMARAKVCIDCRYIGPRPSGIAEVVQALVDHVPAMAPDLDFLLLRHPMAGRLSHAPNVAEVEVPHAANGPATMWYLPRVVDLSGVHLFHATFNIMPAGLTMPCLATIHDVMWLTHPEWCATGAKGLIDRLFFGHGIRRALRHAAAIATVSEASRNEIVAVAPGTMPRATVTPSGVAEDFQPSGNALDRAALGLTEGRRLILTVGQFAPYKNHQGALAAFALVAKQRPDIDLVFVQRRGKGAEVLLQEAERLGLSGRVFVLAPMSRESLIALYCAATVLLHPSLCEGFGNPLVEAMACGCPVVTSDVSAMPEVTGDAALLAAPQDPSAIAAALASVLDDSDLAAKMRERGLKRAGELTWRSFAATNLDIYRRLLAD